MSLLAPKEQQKSTILARKVAAIKAAPAEIARHLVNMWSSSFDALWRERGEITVAEKLEALGTDAAELFELNSQLVTFLISQIGDKNPVLLEEITRRVASIPAHTIHEDGTVTLNKAE